MTTATKATRTVQIIARIQFKADSRKVVYLVRGSKGEQYETCLFDGKATSCTCESRKPCYHMTQLEQKEAERNTMSVEAAQVPEYGRYLDFNGIWRAIGEEIANPIVIVEEPYERVEIDLEATTQEWIDEEYEFCKATNGLAPMTREAYVQCFDPCGMEVL